MSEWGQAALDGWFDLPAWGKAIVVALFVAGTFAVYVAERAA